MSSGEDTGTEPGGCRGGERRRGSVGIREELDAALVEGAGENVRSRAPEQGKARLQSVHAQTHTHTDTSTDRPTHRWTHTHLETHPDK